MDRRGKYESRWPDNGQRTNRRTVAAAAEPQNQPTRLRAAPAQFCAPELLPRALLDSLADICVALRAEWAAQPAHLRALDLAERSDLCQQCVTLQLRLRLLVVGRTEAGRAAKSDD